MLRVRWRFVAGSLGTAVAAFAGCFAPAYTVRAGAGGAASSSSSGTGGAASSSTSTSSSGAGGAGGAGGECASNQKLCDGGCVKTSDPNYGCGAADCTPCPASQVCAAGACVSCVLEAAAGSAHTCARIQPGALWCWGSNVDGELGNGKTCTPAPCGASSPVHVTALGASVIQVAAGDQHTCALKKDGTLWCWGGNQFGEVGDGTTTPALSPVQVTAIGVDVIQIVAGGNHTCARNVDGTLWCWGSNVDGELGDGATCTPAPCGEFSPVQVTALGASVVEVVAGAAHTCARKVDGTLWCWGSALYYQLGDGTNVTSVSPIQVTALGTSVAEVAAGENHTCARKVDGTLWCWGANADGEVGDGTTGSFTASPAQVTALGASVAEVAAGGRHTCARKVDGTLWCWGANADGEVGDGTSVTPRPSPVQVSALGASVVEIAAGGNHTCAREMDGTLWCWGDDAVGQIGDGTSVTPKPTPVLVTLTCP